VRSGAKIITDAPPDNRGKGEAFSPTDLVATALASCMMTIMGMAARDHGLDITGATASVNKVMAAGPRRIARVEVRFDMPERPYTPDERLLLESAALGCPVCESLRLECEQAVSFHWPV
jgi:uncharacterized OsmC-like protein